MHYLKFKREKIDRCNICSQIAQLTWDHVPPQGGYKVTEVEQESIIQYLTGGAKKSYTFSQNGVKYRSICGSCNNGLLGSRFDTVLNEFTTDIMLMVKTSIQLPKGIIRVKTRPGLLAKAVIGHMLSASGEYGESKFDDRFRKYVLDDSLISPEGLRIFYWIYPYSSIKIIRDVGMPKYRGSWEDFKRGIGIFSIMKYFPIGFIVSDVEKYEGLEELTQYCGSNLSDEAFIRINLHDVREEYWPEVGDDNILLGGNGLGNGVSALPRRRKKN
ncbi:hypothetical protein ABER61_24240 [Brevibacillus formosus]|uniref:HNH endonuclease 5 domain-containing protein n=1 Tax=Brevibacillus formosus TaxID=54913 RepID=A0ABQ0TBX5_9BACL|nr:MULTISPECIES: hypothetical protein [Brevibacillus]MED1948214.1 hypothetical protein [Brevibacillus formosus]MED1960691.1 hypothetical protein [Brevibacillus formosus]MED1998055.1 hypothetical protein [Brevibacillus formosus]MED2080596.1 hypothetical protein [Brevibacillus formosus]PSJ92251.1 hypothetical protein C7R91_24290 [Brevibacillus formosus]